MPNGKPRGRTEDHNQWTQEGESAWDEEQEVMVDTLWYQSLSNMRKRASVRLDAEDIRDARRKILPGKQDARMKVAWRILCYFFLAAAAFAGREGYSQNSYVLVGMSVLVVLATGALLETVLRKP